MNLLSKTKAVKNEGDASVASTPSMKTTKKKNSSTLGRTKKGQSDASVVSTRSVMSRFTMAKAPKPAGDDSTIEGRMQNAFLKEGDRSDEIAALTQKYSHMKTDLGSLIEAVQTYHDTMIANTDARKKVSEKIASLSLCSPIYESAGSTTRNAESFATIVQASALESNSLAETYKEDVIARAEDWQKVVSERVDSELEKTSSLRDSITHYQIKVGDTMKKIEAKETSEKAVPKKLQSKLGRNEKKMEQAWKEHDVHASKVCHLLDEVTQRGWKDLFPLVKTIVEWEVTRVNTEDKELASKAPAILSNLDLQYKTSMIEAPVDDVTLSGTYSEDSEGEE